MYKDRRKGENRETDNTHLSIGRPASGHTNRKVHSYRKKRNAREDVAEIGIMDIIPAEVGVAATQHLAPLGARNQVTLQRDTTTRLVMNVITSRIIVYC